MAAVLVHIELDGERAAATSLAALAAGRQLASAWGATLYAAVIVHDAAGALTDGVGAAHEPIARAGADKLIVAATDVAIAPSWSALGPAWLAILDYVQPRVVLFGADDRAAAELVERTGKQLGAQVMAELHVAGDPLELRGADGRTLAIGDFPLVVATIARAAGAAIVAVGDDEIDVIKLAAPSAAARTPEARR